MPSASPSCDHHRAEVAEVGDDVPGPLEGHALVRPQRGILVRRTASAAGRRAGRRARAGDVEAELRRPRP